MCHISIISFSKILNMARLGKKRCVVHHYIFVKVKKLWETVREKLVNSIVFIENYKYGEKEGRYVPVDSVPAF